MDIKDLIPILSQCPALAVLVGLTIWLTKSFITAMEKRDEIIKTINADNVISREKLGMIIERNSLLVGENTSALKEANRK